MNKDNRINAITQAISQQRLQKFLSHSGDDFEKALELYEKNMRISADIFPIISCFEICLRNKIHDTMQQDYGVEWLINPQTPLTDESREKIEKVRARLPGNKINDTPSEYMGRIVAGLSLGFWVVLLGAQYDESLWRPTLCRAFPNYTGFLKPLRSRIYKISTLRNNVAHHDPIIFPDNTGQRRGEIIETIGWMCLDTGNWVGRLRPLQLG